MAVNNGSSNLRFNPLDYGSIVFRPCETRIVTQPFAVNPQNYTIWGNCGHEGIDLAVKQGEPYFSIGAGVVVHTGNTRWSSNTESAYGWHVVIEHIPHKVFSLYAHASESLPVRVGQPVQAGQVIAYSGNTGRSSGPHLHFSILTRHITCWPKTKFGYFTDPGLILTLPCVTDLEPVFTVADFKRKLGEIFD